MNLEISLHPLDPLSSPCWRTERIREVLRLASNLAIAELHDADRVDCPLIVADHVLSDPQVAASEHAQDGEAQLGRVVPAQGLDIAPAADPLTRLGILDHDLIVVDLVFGVQVTRRGGRPVLVQGCSNCLILYRLSPLPFDCLYQALEGAKIASLTDRLLLEQRLVCLDGRTITLQHTIQVRHHVFTIVPGASMSIKRSLVSELSTSVVF